GLHVLQSLGHHGAGPVVVRAGLRHQPARRRPARPAADGTGGVSALLDVESLDIGFGPLSAVRGASLAVGKGETHCLVGESGCGKSVTALAVMGLLPSNARRS